MPLDVLDLSCGAILQGVIDAEVQIGRTEGFTEKLAEHPNWNLLDKESGEFQESGGQEVMESFLEKYSNIDVVVAENDDMALGAIEAIKAAGKTCGPDGDITIISYDATKDGFKAMIAGDLDADVECNPLFGPYVEEIIRKLEAGEPVENAIVI